MDKYSIKIMDIVVNGEKVGELTRNLTARQYASEHWSMCQIRKILKEQINNTKMYKTPIITEAV